MQDELPDTETETYEHIPWSRLTLTNEAAGRGKWMYFATALLVAAAIAAAVDWWAVATSRRSTEVTAKPIAMASLLGVALVGGGVPGDVRVALVVGAALGLIGDVALLGESDAAFMTGLGAFAVGHIAYVVAAVLVGFDVLWTLPGIAFSAILLGTRFVTHTVPGARRAGGDVLAGVVVLYSIVISVMVSSAWATRIWLAAVGAMLFAFSDWMLGYQRFVNRVRHGRLAVIVPYHVGQAMLIVGLAVA